MEDDKLIGIDMWVNRHEAGGGAKEGAAPTGFSSGIPQSGGVAERAERADVADRANEADHANTANEAEHAKSADEANHAKTADEVNLESKTLSHFLRKDIPDTAVEVLTFLKGIVAKGVSYFKGIFNDGDINNSGNIMTKNLTVTGKATFFELEILKAKAAGGIIIQSAGTFKVDDCEETDEGYVCYQLAEKDGKTLSQTCEMGDQMLCCGGLNETNQPNQPNQPNQANISNHFYWRLVMEAPTTSVRRNIDGEEVECLKIVLSKTDFAEGSDKPQVGDELAQVGNRDNKERQSVIMTCAYKGLDGDLKTPYWVQYTGVNTYELSKFKRTWFAANGSQVTGNFKVQSDNGGLESIEDYVKGLATEKGKDTVVWQVAFSIRHITDKQDETFRLKVVRIVGDKAEEVDYAAIYAAGADLLVFGDNMGTEVRVTPGKDYLTAEYSHSRYLMARVVRYDTDITLAQDTIYAKAVDGKPGKDAITYKLIPLAEEAVAYITEDKKKMIYLSLSYNIQKAVGEQVSIVTDLRTEDMTLTAWTNKMETFELEGDEYGLSYSMEYDKMSNDSYVVTLTKGGNIVDQRIVPITFKPKVVFDIDTKNGTITSQIEAANGKINSVERDLNQTKATVGELDGKYSQLKMKSDKISLTVNNGTRPNLLWGSDLNLDGVDTTNKAAIQKHLGVGLNATKVDSTEWFEYLKGGGVGGADAVKAKVTAVNGEGNYFAGLYWQIGFGAKSNIKVKPNTKYTFSFWIRTEILQGRGYAVVDSFNTESLTGGRKDRTMPWTDVKATNEWERKSYTFTTGATGYIMVGVGLSGGKDFSGLIYLCRPKLEEGNEATPWCAYDGTVEALLATGLDIKNRKMIATTDNFVVQNNKGERTVMVDENGKLNTNLIDATEIYGLKIAQPFETYASKEEIIRGKSLSWVIETREKDYGFILGKKGMNGVTSNIFNNTGSDVSFWIPLITPSKTCYVDVPNNVMLRAVSVYRKEWNGCRWYLICPWEDIGNNRIRIKAFG